MLVHGSLFSQVTFGVQGGIQSTTASYSFTQTGQPSSPSTSSVTGLKIGGIASIPLGKDFSFMPELSFVSKGVDYTNIYGYYSNGTWRYKEEEKFRMSYIEIPLSITYTKSKFFGGLGPVFSFGIGGSGSYTETWNILNSSGGYTAQVYKQSDNIGIAFDGTSNVSATDNKYHFKSLEVGGNLFVGYKFTESLFAKLTYNTSFTDILPSEQGYTTKYSSSYVGLSVGYLFNTKTK